LRLAAEQYLLKKCLKGTKPKEKLGGIGTMNGSQPNRREKSLCSGQERSVEGPEGEKETRR